jgi:uncharacterized protein RhaS with RHS repeats
MQARYYDPVIGRFYSNDPVGWTPDNPVMSFNRYLYVNNNPYKYTDPNGEFLFLLFSPTTYTAAKAVADVILTIGFIEAGDAISDYAQESDNVENLNDDVNKLYESGDVKGAFEASVKADNAYLDLAASGGETAQEVSSKVPGNTASGPSPSTNTDAAVIIGNKAKELFTDKDNEYNE